MTLSRVATLLSLLVVLGCGGNADPDANVKLEPVTGSVLVNDKPYAGLSITFLPEQGTPGSGATAVTNDKGEFQLQHRNGKPGVQAGNYRVLFSLLLKSDGSPLGPEDDAAIMGVQKLPPQYQSLDQSPEKASVPSGGAKLDFKLKTKL